MSGEAERDAVKVVLPLADSFANDYVKNPPDRRTVVTIYKYERDGGAYELWWSGNVTMHEVSGGEVTFRAESDETLLAQAARPRIAMVPCPHAVEKPSLCQNSTPKCAGSTPSGTTSAGVMKSPYMSA